MESRDGSHSPRDAVGMAFKDIKGHLKETQENGGDGATGERAGKLEGYGRQSLKRLFTGQLFVSFEFCTICMDVLPSQKFIK